MARRKQYTEEQKQQFKEKAQKQVKDLLAQIEEGVSSLVTSEDWKAFLDFHSKFHSYSLGNTILIRLQCPHASRVAGFKKWKDLGRFVRKGEKGIRILAPVHIKISDENSDEDRILTRFKSVSVFDISQTDGEDTPDICSELDGETVSGDVKESLVSFAESIDFSVEFNNDQCGEAHGYCAPSTREIVISDGLSSDQEIKTLIHEIAHAVLHCDDNSDPHTRQEAEVEAESVAYCVSSLIGLDSASYSFGYVASWSRGDTSLIKKSAERIRGCVETISAAL